MVSYDAFYLDMKDMFSFWPTGGAPRAHSRITQQWLNLYVGFIIIKHVMTYFILSIHILKVLFLHESVLD